MMSDKPSTQDFLGLSFANLSLEQVRSWIEARAVDPAFAYVVTPNVDHIVTLNRTPPDFRSEAFRSAYREADLILCDSRVLGFLARRSGIKLAVVPGSDLVNSLFDCGILDDYTINLIGGEERHVEAIRQRYPAIRCRQYRPPMGVLTKPDVQAEIIDFIVSNPAKITFLAIGAPQAELIAQRCKSTPEISGVGLCIGAAFDFLTGVKRRAPRWMRGSGLEWLHRLASEPGRLWRRYLVDGPRIFSIWWRYNGR